MQFCPIGYNLYAGRYFVGVPWWPTGKESAWSAGAKGYVGSIPGRGSHPRCMVWPMKKQTKKSLREPSSFQSVALKRRPI